MQKTITEKIKLATKCPDCNSKTILFRIADCQRIYCEKCGRRTHNVKVERFTRMELITEFLKEKKKVVGVDV